MNEKTHLDLFSGIGGFALAAKWNGYRTVGFCDNEPYAQAVLNKHWPEVPCHKDIREVRGELDTVCADLEAEGYEVEPIIIPACAVDAPHRRDRVWIVGHSKLDGLTASKTSGGLLDQSEKQGRKIKEWESSGTSCASSDVADSISLSEGGAHRSKELAHGVPNRVAKLRGLGNAIVPQVAAEIIRCINKVMEDSK
ncbi:MAG: hypothetical protein EBR82_65425 [Caulobacteraceae bacterium]|nr:hypothetical protein [Caulobacteraceae bacterium]